MQPATPPIQPGFADPVDDANGVFRLVLKAIAHPGTIVEITRPASVPEGTLGRAAIGVALALVDFETPAWLDAVAAPVGPHLRFHCNCPIVATPDRAAFLFVADPTRMPALADLPLGSDAYPDQGAPLVIEVATLAADGPLVLEGPGIDGQAHLAVGGLPPSFWSRRAALAPLFPRGIDILLCHGDRLVALPRTTAVRER
ncbi:MAG TPA: phosphonate C-P lyase system protein PhnH [Aliidongia sp.]|uniref:phosphonate C-P lyase system protein PhnH n=1 Tax=Aliidongia sp. TaxID=1914230 RepID=UPI002DDCA91E|nr:phosphonate C-P lyase system protein PhnH [Aliidongia sp.]HEV2675571.1 phosphonate C-P lyase system protein PhnH [Aliidongia sp.]